MSQSLFFEPDVHFEKVASETQLPDDPNQWPNEILDEVYRQVPYLSDFDLDVVMDRVDAERGFGFGHVEVGSKTEAPATASTEDLQNAGVRQARIPIIVCENRLQPLDVLVTDDARMLPLTEQRLRQAVFRPQSFDVTSKSPGDQSMVGQLYPPTRQNHGFSGGGEGMGSKVAARQGSPLAMVLCSANETDLDSFKEAMLDRGLQMAYLENPATYDAVEKIATALPTGVKTASVLQQLIRPTVVQLTKFAQGYCLKTASRLMWEPREELLDRGEAVRRCGEKIVLAADLTGSITTTPEDGVAEPEQEMTNSAPVESSGRYKVTTAEGQPLEGNVLVNLLDLDGTAKPIALFTNGSHTAVQADIDGVPMGPIDTLQGVAAGQATGHGVFFTMEAGFPVATIPLEIKAPFEGPQGTMLMGETFDGRPVEISVQPSIQSLVSFDGQLLVPQDWQWLTLGETSDVALLGGIDAAKLAHITTLGSTVEVRCGGTDSYSVRGPAVEKLAAEEREFLSQDDTMFLLAGLGANLKTASAKIAESHGGFRPVRIPVGEGFKTAEEMRGESRFAAEQYLSTAPSFRYQLWKEASVVPDPVAVDTILSLGFINPENVAAFIGYLPVIDEAQCRMCELLIASRLGMSHVPTPALEKAIRATEGVIEGLKEMAFQE